MGNEPIVSNASSDRHRSLAAFFFPSSVGFTGSSDSFTIDDLDAQGAETWDNTSFKNQNAIEADDAYIGSLETAGATGDIGAEYGNTIPDPITGEEPTQD